MALYKSIIITIIIILGLPVHPVCIRHQSVYIHIFTYLCQPLFWYWYTYFIFCKRVNDILLFRTDKSTLNIKQYFGQKQLGHYWLACWTSDR